MIQYTELPAVEVPFRVASNHFDRFYQSYSRMLYILEGKEDMDTMDRLCPQEMQNKCFEDDDEGIAESGI